MTLSTFKLMEHGVSSRCDVESVETLLWESNAGQRFLLVSLHFLRKAFLSLYLSFEFSTY